MASILPARGTCEKTERGFCSSSRYGEKISRFLKFHFHLPRNGLGKRHVEQAKMVKNEKSGFFFGKVVFRTPPEVVSGFFFFWGGGGGGSAGIGADTCPGVVLENYHSGPPPPPPPSR
jgi:hypothetical protein